VNRQLLRVDMGLFVPALVLLIIGLAGIFSLSLDLFKAQLLFSVLAILVFIFFSQINYQSLKNYSVLIYIASIVILFLVLLIGIESKGSVRWFEFFGFRVQFSELLKPFLALCLSSFLASKNNYSIKLFFLTLALLFPIWFLIFLQPDLGNAIIYFLVTIFIMFIFGFPLRYFLASLFLMVVSFPIFWRFLREYQKQRVLTFFHLKVDPLGTSYNAIQSVIAVGSGMIMGRGLGQGTQSILRFLPERHTDFIFATLSEELGFIGSALILTAFGFLFYRIFLIYKNSDSVFSKVFAQTAFFLFLIQFFMNIGMNIGIMPIVGVSLPFISYGGSSLFSSFILLGFLSSMSKGVDSKKVLEIR